MAGIFSRIPRAHGTPAHRDLIVIGTAVSALLALAWFGNHYFEALTRQLVRIGADNSSLVIGLLLLNVALTIYGWRRYRDAEQQVIERTAAEQRAQTLASTDPLTGFLNRRSLSEAVGELIATAGKRQRAVATLIVDLDGFKTVNDLHGHLTGDNLLCVAADIIRHAMPEGGIGARLGGDEFAAVFPFDPAEPIAAEAVAAAIVEGLGRPLDLAGVHTHVSASVGIARSDHECADVDALLRRADIAMYSAKKLGRARYVWFDASMERELHHRNMIEAGLRSGIPAGEFVPYFEQQVDLVTGTLHGFEMLARWRHPERGLVPPDEFIHIAEDCGLIADLSMSVMRQAFEEARGWDASLMLSVNISPSQLKDPWMSQRILKLLTETGFPAERLEIEITESSLFENLGLAQSIVTSLKNQGIRLALDDFGTGYSSLAHLRALPFDRIKIDRSFVKSINDNEESVAIVSAITRLAESLNLAVTAEGIEDELIEARLRSIGRYQGQGWLFGKPAPISATRQILAERALLPADHASPEAEREEALRRAG